MATVTTDSALSALAAGRYRDPFSLLGPHPASGGCVIRTLQPAAASVEVRLVASGELRPMERRLDPGLFEVAVAGSGVPDYRLRISYVWGEVREIDDPYRYGRV